MILLESLIESRGEDWLMLMTGLGVGLVFGSAAYHSRFCLRAATAEVSSGVLGPRLSIWLVAFFAALASTQLAILAGFLDVGEVRQLASIGSLSGAIIGGLMFGCGMTFARGCASRLLVLSASGNLRAIVTGLVLTLTAQASLRGILSPLRETLAALWTVPGGDARRMVDPASEIFPFVVAFCVAVLVLSIWFGIRRQVRSSELFAAACVGFSVYLGWQITYLIATSSFEVVAVQSVTFTGPSTDTLMALVNDSEFIFSFGLGLVPGVFLGSMSTAILMGEARIQRFGSDTPMERYLLGGILMGFGSMLAGGCAVGAGMSGGAIFALTAWVAVFCMWLGAVATQWVISGRSSPSVNRIQS